MMPDKVAPAPVAVQIYDQPTNKLSVGTNVASGVGGVLAGVFAVYGADAIREVWEQALGLTTPKMEDLVVFALVGIAGFFGSKYAGLAAGWQVLDKPNQQMVPGGLPGEPNVVKETK
jgi:hypothetical protein